MKKMLQLKEIVPKSESMERIYSMSKETCESFNSYYLDFFESVAILEENKSKESNSQKLKEIEESIHFMHGKIEELSGFMENISKQMPDLIELKQVQ